MPRATRVFVRRGSSLFSLDLMRALRVVAVAVRSLSPSVFARMPPMRTSRSWRNLFERAITPRHPVIEGSVAAVSGSDIRIAL